MTKQIYINLPVRDLLASTVFYEKLGFVKNPMFSNDTTGNALVWSDDIVVMLLAQDFYKTFIGDKEIADTKKTSAALLCINFDSKDEVDRFADMAVENGGRKHVVKVSGTEEFMYNYEVEDLDGHTWEPMYMDVTKFTGA